MVDPLVPPGHGHTELAPDDREGLIPTYIATRGELFEAEQRNISEALLGPSPTVDVLLDDVYLRRLHERMFADVWSWAGRYRTRDTNLGVPWEQIVGAVRDLVLDVRMWIDTSTYEPDDIGVRFHHRSTVTHPFPNGNGRHSRIAADYLIMGLSNPRFSWGAKRERTTEDLRRAYVSALRTADDGDMSELIAFSRS